MSTMPTGPTPALDTRTLTTTVRYFAGAKAAAGTRTETLTLPPGTTLADLLLAIAADHGDALTRVLASSSLLVDEVAAHDHGVVLADGAVVDVLPPFAGG